MDVVVVYESAFAGTRRVAEAVGASLGRVRDTSVQVLPTGAVTPDDLARADLLVVGGPTHPAAPVAVGPRGNVRRAVRQLGSYEVGGRGAPTVAPPAVVDLVAEAERVTDPDLVSIGPGLRRWFHGLGPSHGRVAAAFDVHVDGERGAAGVIARRLGRHGYRVVAAEGFAVDDESGPISDDELVRAARWASDLAHQVASALPR